MDVEGDLLGVGAPVLIAEAVDVLSVGLRIKGEVPIGDRLLVRLVLAVRIRDLQL